MSNEELGITGDGEPVKIEAEEPEKVLPVEGADEPAGEETGETEQHKKKTGSQRAREALQREREQRIRLEAQIEMLQKNQAQPAKEDPDAPRLEDFETLTEWVSATTKHGIAKAMEARKEQERTQTWQQKWESKAEKARERYEDFDDALSFMPPVPGHVAEVLADSDHEADLAYHLATHPEELKRLSAMSPSLAGRELAKLEAKFNTPTPKTERKSTQAPPPPTPVGAKGIPATDPSKWTDKEWAEHRKAQRLR